MGKKWTRKTPQIISKETRAKISKTLMGRNRGEKSANWKGGRTQLRFTINNSFRYRQWRSDIFTRDNYTCQFCGIRGVTINADHIKTFSKILDDNQITTYQEALDCEELWNLNNGRTLCKPCHRATPTWGRKKKVLSTRV